MWNAGTKSSTWGALLILSSHLQLAFGFNVSELDCKMRAMALDFGKTLIPGRQDLPELLSDALEVGRLCNSSTFRNKFDAEAIEHKACSTYHCIFVDPTNSATTSRTSRRGTIDHPLSSIHFALERSRNLADPFNTTIVLREGEHFIESPIRLGPKDSGLTFAGYPEEKIWISGAIPIPNEMHWDWDCDLSIHVRVANLSKVLNGKRIPRVASLFNSEKRLIRARFPNGDPETDQWGYKTPRRFEHCIPAEEVIEWEKPRPGVVPTFEYVDLRQHDPVKNDSTMAMYNVYASGTGGVCAELWGPHVDSYWCSNASAGGWSEVDRECAINGTLQIPVGMRWNQTSPIGEYINEWGPSAVGGIVHAWHSQTWAMHMFEVNSTDESGKFGFSERSGNQGGRNWCRCDQCTYAGHWCGQHLDPPVHDDRLIGGNWLVENVLRLLDVPGEFFFDKASKLLYVYPNASGLENLRFASLDSYMVLKGSDNIKLSNIGFRHSAATFLGDWDTPSGGDWALSHRAVLTIDDASYVTIENCTFHRLDGNAIMLKNGTRRVSIRGNIFEWIGENAIVLRGSTKGFDATGRSQPKVTFIVNNVMRELGIYQKQSSAVALFKSSETVIRRNIMFNMPRAAINFNDMTAGGDVVQGNLIFNTCRESGDHGPINTWDRQPFMTISREGKPSFEPKYRSIDNNLIFANYGAGSGLDNDDGSSWYRVRNNVFYDSEGFKMDYGGHDSLFFGNVVIALPSKGGRQKCIYFGSFFQGRAHKVFNNICIVPGSGEPIVQLTYCHGPGIPVLHNNTYFSPNGRAMAQCGDEDDPIPFSRLQDYGIEENSTVNDLPTSADRILQWCERRLYVDSYFATSGKRID